MHRHGAGPWGHTETHKQVVGRTLRLELPAGGEAVGRGHLGGEGAGQRGQSTPGHGILPCDIGDEHLQMRRLLFPETLWPWGSKRELSLWLSGCGQWGGPRVQQSGGGHGRHARRPAGGH